MLPSRSGILAEANKALHLALYSKDDLFLLLRYCNVHISEAVVRSCSLKKMLLIIFRNSQEAPVNFATF